MRYLTRSFVTGRVQILVGDLTHAFVGDLADTLVADLTRRVPRGPPSPDLPGLPGRLAGLPKLARLARLPKLAGPLHGVATGVPGTRLRCAPTLPRTGRPARRPLGRRRLGSPRLCQPRLRQPRLRWSGLGKSGLCWSRLGQPGLRKRRPLGHPAPRSRPLRAGLGLLAALPLRLRSLALTPLPLVPPALASLALGPSPLGCLPRPARQGLLLGAGDLLGVRHRGDLGGIRDLDSLRHERRMALPPYPSVDGDFVLLGQRGHAAPGRRFPQIPELRRNQFWQAFTFQHGPGG
jgi:hypothetical protein